MAALPVVAAAPDVVDLVMQGDNGPPVVEESRDERGWRGQFVGGQPRLFEDVGDEVVALGGVEDGDGTGRVDGVRQEMPGVPGPGGTGAG